MLALKTDAIEKRAINFIQRFSGLDSTGLTATIVAGQSAVGGGSGPTTHPQTALIALKHQSLNAADLDKKLRLFSTPVIARIAEDLVLLDLRTVDLKEEPDLLEALISLGP
jgi:L-seryl-tRNA(Ser) seleniumtransferase